MASSLLSGAVTFECKRYDVCLSLERLRKELFCQSITVSLGPWF